MNFSLPSLLLKLPSNLINKPDKLVVSSIYSEIQGLCETSAIAGEMVQNQGLNIRWRSLIYVMFAIHIPTHENREFTQPRRRRQQERHKFAYLTVKNNRFARFARAVFTFGHSADVLVLSTTWNDLFCSCEDDVSTRWQMFNFVFLSLKRWFQFNSRKVRTHFATVMTLNNWEMIAETRSYIFRWRSRCRRRRVCVNSLISVYVLDRYIRTCSNSITFRINPFDNFIYRFTILY